MCINVDYLYVKVYNFSVLNTLLLENSSANRYVAKTIGNGNIS